jgi:hypothetical protein
MNTMARDAKTVGSPKRLARIAGVLYVINAIVSIFSYGYVTTATVYVPGDAAATAQRVVANTGLLRMGVVADLLQATEWVFLAIALYLLLRHVSENAARLMVILVAVGTAIVCLNEVFQFGALLVATGQAYATGLGAAGSNALVLLLFDLHHYGFLIAQIYFGLWLVPLGYLAYRSGLFPKTLGILLVVGGACYLVDMLALFLAPAFGAAINTFVVIPPTVAELWMAGYLLVVGVRSSTPTGHTPVAA